MSSVYSCSGFTNTQDVECTICRAVVLRVLRTSTWILMSSSGTTWRHREAFTDAACAGCADHHRGRAFFFGVVEFEAYDQSLRSDLIAKHADANRRSFSVQRRGPRNIWHEPTCQRTCVSWGVLVFLAVRATGAHWEHVAVVLLPIFWLTWTTGRFALTRSSGICRMSRECGASLHWLRKAFCCSFLYHEHRTVVYRIDLNMT